MRIHNSPLALFCSLALSLGVGCSDKKSNKAAVAGPRNGSGSSAAPAAPAAIPATPCTEPAATATANAAGSTTALTDASDLLALNLADAATGTTATSSGTTATSSGTTAANASGTAAAATTTECVGSSGAPALPAATAGNSAGTAEPAEDPTAKIATVSFGSAVTFTSCAALGKAWVPKQDGTASCGDPLVSWCCDAKTVSLQFPSAAAALTQAFSPYVAKGNIMYHCSLGKGLNLAGQSVSQYNFYFFKAGDINFSMGAVFIQSAVPAKPDSPACPAVTAAQIGLAK